MLDDWDEPNLYTEIQSKLWIGRTDENDLVGLPRSHPRIEDKSLFSAVITLNPIANPFGWYVQEFRYGFPDGKLLQSDIKVLEQAADFGYRTWKQNQHVMVRCQEGINRSALLVAMILIKDGMKPHEAVELIRSKRSRYCLSNPSFLDFISTFKP